MKAEFNILIEWYEELNCTVDFTRFRDTDQDEAEIVINSIQHEGKEVINQVTEAEMDKLKDKCELYYNHQQFIWMIEREQDAFMIEQRDK